MKYVRSRCQVWPSFSLETFCMNECRRDVSTAQERVLGVYPKCVAQKNYFSTLGVQLVSRFLTFSLLHNKGLNTEGPTGFTVQNNRCKPTGNHFRSTQLSRCVQLTSQQKQYLLTCKQTWRTSNMFTSVHMTNMDKGGRQKPGNAQLAVSHL